MKDHDYAMALVRKRTLQLVFFPGETTDAEGTARGHIYVYVKGKLVKSIDAVGGPPPGEGSSGPGGHTAGVTPWGNYVLGSLHRHTTKNWPMSVVPWGAKLRETKDKEIEFSGDGGKTWLAATGKNGLVTASYNLFDERTEASTARVEGRKPLPLSQAAKDENNSAARRAFYNPPGKLLPFYNLNDFGAWSWNMNQNGGATPYYIHTTPDDENDTAAGKTPKLSQSHGCVHIRPKERDEWMQAGYLKKGNPFFVAHYGVQGP